MMSSEKWFQSSTSKKIPGMHHKYNNTLKKISPIIFLFLLP
jgi:hypothetical protein